jgi:uncharacterized protein (TIGR00369 family)
MTGAGPFHIAGNWQSSELTNGGAWTLGPLWLDRASHRFALQIGPQHCNALGSMHGGAMATFMDGQAFAVVDLAPDGSDHTPTISLQIDYMAPAVAGDWLVADVILVRTTRTMIFTQTIAWVGERPVARSHAIYSNARRKLSQN